MIKLEEGTFFITDSDGTKLELLNSPNIESAAELKIPDAPDHAVVNQIISTPGEFTATMKVTKEQYFRMIDTFIGLFETICVICPNKRVIHLAIYGKKRKTRKKNRMRAVKILEKEA